MPNIYPIRANGTTTQYPYQEDDNLKTIMARLECGEGSWASASSYTDAAGVVTAYVQRTFKLSHKSLSTVDAVALETFFRSMQGRTGQFQYTDDDGITWPNSFFATDTLEINYQGPNEYQMDVEIVAAVEVPIAPASGTIWETSSVISSDPNPTPADILTISINSSSALDVSTTTLSVTITGHDGSGAAKSLTVTCDQPTWFGNNNAFPDAHLGWTGVVTGFSATGSFDSRDSGDVPVATIGFTIIINGAFATDFNNPETVTYTSRTTTGSIANVPIHT